MAQRKTSTILLLILAFALAVRLVHIDFPVGGFAAWRQADTAAMSRNFFEQGYDFFRPQIDWGGNGPGYVETEFPLYQYLVALLYGLFGPQEWLGRALSTACALLSVVGLFLFVRKVFNQRVALWAAGFYALGPLNIFYSRAFMPESMMLMASVWGVFFFYRWTTEDRLSDLALSALCIALAALLKITALFLGVPLLWLAWSKFRWAFLSKPVLWTYATLVLVLVGVWYYHAHMLYLQSGLTFGIWLPGKNKWGMVGPLFSLKFYNDVFFKSIAERHLTYAGFFLFLIGLFLHRESPAERLFDWWLIGFLFFVAVVTTGNQIHEYYQLPVVIPAAVFVGKALDRFTRRGAWQEGRRTLTAVVWCCLVFFLLLSAHRVYHYLKGEDPSGPLFQLADAVQQYSAAGDLVIAFDDYDPIFLYRSHRKGWHCTVAELSEKFLDEKSQQGAKLLFADQSVIHDSNAESAFAEVKRHYRVLAQNAEYVIIDLHGSSDSPPAR